MLPEELYAWYMARNGPARPVLAYRIENQLELFTNSETAMVKLVDAAHNCAVVRHDVYLKFRAMLTREERVHLRLRVPRYLQKALQAATGTHLTSQECLF